MKPVAAAICLHQGKILLTRRAPEEKNAGKWEFPGGKLEEGERAEEALARELKEELGVKAVVGDFFMETIYHYEHGAIKLLSYYTELEDQNFTLMVHDEVAWVLPEQLLDYDLTPADIPIAKRLQSVVS